MKRVWAPWRIEYITQPKQEGCIFCDKPKENDKDRENLILYRGESCFVIMNYYPYNNCHLMVAPYQHTTSLAELGLSQKTELMTLLEKCSEILYKAIKAEGMNIGVNLGKAAGAGIDDHLHIHVVPRWIGDTNFMPTIGHCKVLSQGLYDSWDLLHPSFNKK